MPKEKNLAQDEQSALINILKARFDKHPERHKGIQWDSVQLRLLDNPDKLWSLLQMEKTEGEPDVVGLDTDTGAYLFMDCASESPKGRRSLCYDQAALESRKLHKPNGSAVAFAEKMGLELLTENQYKSLQTLGTFDAKTSSWLQTPSEIRALGGAIFGDYRFGKVFIYHNGAESYYGVRGFRCVLKV